MLIALVTALLLMTGGGVAGYIYDLNGLEKTVKSEVQDDTRKDAAVDIVKSMQDRDKEFRNTLTDYIESLDKQFQGRTLSEAEVNDIIGTYTEKVTDYQDDMIDSRFALREQVSRDEWAVIFAAP